MTNGSKILTAGKYAELGSAKSQGGSTAGQSSSKKPVQTFGSHRQDACATRLFVPTLTGAAARVKLADWYWREIKEGGLLLEYLNSEKRKMPHLIRKVARIMAGFQQNNKSDFRRLAAVPARLYHRWKAEDEHFFEDNENLRSLKRDNPDLPVYLGARQMPVSRFRKTYPRRSAPSQSGDMSPHSKLTGGTPVAL